MLLPFLLQDEMYQRLMYIQILDDVIHGHLPIADGKRVVQLVAQALAVDFMTDFPDNEDLLLDNEMMEYVPLHWRPKKTEEEWAAAVLSCRSRVVNEDPAQLQVNFMRTVQGHALLIAHNFYTRKVYSPMMLPSKLTVVLNCDGMHFLEERRTGEWKRHKSFDYADLYRWGGSTTQLQLTIWDQKTQSTFEVLLKTSQAADIAAIISDYIERIMGE